MTINALMGAGNYSATSNNIKLVDWPLMGGLLHLVPNVTAHPSTASVPITVLLYNGPLFGGFNVPVKGSTESTVKLISIGDARLCVTVSDVTTLTCQLHQSTVSDTAHCTTASDQSDTVFYQ